MVIHDFYCMNCGEKGIPLPRKTGHQHGKHHRKKMYCLKCKMEVNHIEVRTEEERAEFFENFNNEVYVNEVAESLAYLKAKV